MDGHDTNIVMGDRTPRLATCGAWRLWTIRWRRIPSRRYKAIYEIGPPGFRVSRTSCQGRTCDGPIPPTASTGRPTTSHPCSRGWAQSRATASIPFFDPSTRTYNILTRHPLDGNGAAAAGGTRSRRPSPAGRPPTRRYGLLKPARDAPHLPVAEPGLPPLERATRGSGARPGAGQPGRLVLQHAALPAREPLGGLSWACFNMTSGTLFPQLAFSRDARTWDRLQPTHTWIGERRPRLVLASSSWRRRTWLTWALSRGCISEASVEAFPRMNATPTGWVWASCVGTASSPLGRTTCTRACCSRRRSSRRGDRLVINAACGPQGYIKVEAADVTYTRNARPLGAPTATSSPATPSPTPSPGAAIPPCLYPRDIGLRHRLPHLHPPPPPTLLHARRAALLVSDHQLGGLIRAGGWGQRALVVWSGIRSISAGEPIHTLRST